MRRKNHSCTGRRHDDSCAACINLRAVRQAKAKLASDHRLMALVNDFAKDLAAIEVEQEDIVNCLLSSAIGFAARAGMPIEDTLSRVRAIHTVYVDMQTQDKERSHLSVVEPTDP